MFTHPSCLACPQFVCDHSGTVLPFHVFLCELGLSEVNLLIS